MLRLIINEAVTKSIKYTFPGGRKGIISVTQHEVNEHVALMICR